MCFKIILGILFDSWNNIPKIDHLLELVEGTLPVHVQVPAPYFKPRKNLLKANMANKHCWRGI